MNKEEIENRIKELEEKKLNKKLNTKIKEMLSFIGFILSSLGAVGYFITIMTLVLGASGLQFELIGKDGIFFIIGFTFGLVIRSGFYIQGITYAKQEFKEVISNYHNLIVTGTKEKKRQSFEFKLGFEIFRTTVMQFITYGIGTMGLIYLAGFSGMNNSVYIWNAISNLFMFTGFGFLALNSSYEKYIIYKIPRIKEKIRVIEKELANEKVPSNVTTDINTSDNVMTKPPQDDFVIYKPQQNIKEA